MNACIRSEFRWLLQHSRRTRMTRRGVSPLNISGVTGVQKGTLMKRHYFTSYPLFALIGLILSPLAVVHAVPSPADSVPKCALFDYEQWRRDHPRPAGKRLADLDVGEPRTVRMIYFLPKGRPYDAAVVDTIKTMMLRMQDFFAVQMERHGHGHLRLRFEADAQGEPLVHRIDGKRSISYYNERNTTGRAWDEIIDVFDIEANVYYITIDNGNSSFYADDKLVGGVGGSAGKHGGWGIVPSKADFGTVAHELGHAFGLLHDFRDDTYIMSYGYLPPWLYADQLSACNAEFLAVHPYFNSTSPIREGAKPTIEQDTKSPITVGVNATSIPLRVKVRDSDGLHQVILFSKTQIPHFAAGRLEVKACRGLEGKRDPVVEFDYDGFVPSQPTSDFNSFKTHWLRMQATDQSGNVAYSEQFELVSTGFREPTATFRPSEGRFASSLFFLADGKLLTLGASNRQDEDGYLEDSRVTLSDVSRGKSIATFPTWEQVQPTVLSPVAALSPDGKLLALEGPIGTIKLWDVSRREVRVAIVDAHEKDEVISRVGGVSSLSFSPDGRLLASGGWFDSQVKLWDASSGEHVATVSKDKKWKGVILSVVFSPDGRLLASGSENGTVELWDVSRKEHVTTIATHENLWQWGPLSFSLDGRLLISGGSGWHGDTEHTEVKLWDVSTGKSIATLSGSGPVSISLMAGGWLRLRR